MSVPAEVSGFRLTDRDLAMVRWVGRWRFVEAAQVAQRFDMDARNAYRRLRGLVRLGLLAHRRILHAQPGAYWATRAGLKATALALPVAGVDIRTYDHDLLAVSVSIELEREFGAAVVVTEREMRSHDSAARDRPRYAVVRAGARPGPGGLHFPDLAVDRTDDRPLAVEVELTAKGRTRLDSIVSGYVRARHIDSIRYYVAPAAQRGVERAVSRAKAEELFDVRPIGRGRP